MDIELGLSVREKGFFPIICYCVGSLVFTMQKMLS